MRKVELKVINISNSQAQASAYAMVLQEVDGDRQLPVIIGSAEAQSIALRLKDIQPPRPLTHDLFASCLNAFDILTIEVLIYKANEGVFYSYIYFRRGETEIRLDARTSDAVALAIRCHCPIYVYESVLEKESITLQEREAMEEEEEAGDMEETEVNKYGRENLETLQKALQKAINEENYELASVIRDEIMRRK